MKNNYPLSIFMVENDGVLMVEKIHFKREGDAFSVLFEAKKAADVLSSLVHAKVLELLASLPVGQKFFMAPDDVVHATDLVLKGINLGISQVGEGARRVFISFRECIGSMICAIKPEFRDFMIGANRSQELNGVLIQDVLAKVREALAEIHESLTDLKISGGDTEVATQAIEKKCYDLMFLTELGLYAGETRESGFPEDYSDLRAIISDLEQDLANQNKQIQDLRSRLTSK